MNSGTAQADWAINRNPDHDLKGVASKLRCLGKYNNATDNQVIASCLMRRPAADLLEAHTRHYANANIKAASPVISRPDEPESTRIVPDEPSILAKAAKDVPLLIGVTRHESMWMVNILAKYIKTTFVPTETFYRTYLFPKIYSLTGIRDDKLHMVDLIYKKQFFSYASHKDMANLTVIVPGLVDLLSTVTMKNPAAQVPKNNTRVKNYLYSFEYDGRLHVPGNGIGDSPNSLFKKGTPHGDDMVYLTPKPDIKEPFNKEEVAFSKKMVDMWANFIISGNPNVPKKVTDPEWPRYEYYKDKLYYKIGRVNKVGTDFTSEFYTVVNDFVTNPKKF
ncbi:carboxylesterase 4A-like isoform X1 [Cloeon dipterum]|uniref:carboxylesterase 4A-like isoform X1 n=1 Tax=Cloeon dipterum TaxID=197152 RepID=UPI0032203122